MSASITKQGIIFADGESIGENLLLAIPKSHNATSYTAYQFNLSENLVANQTYTVQLWDVDVSHSAKTEAQLGVDIYWGGGSLRMIYWHGTNHFTNGHADYLVGSFTPNSTHASHADAANKWLNIYNSVSYADGTRSLTIGKWKLEIGSTPTPWTPNPNDAIYTGEHGFFEGSDIASIGKGYVSGREFYEM